MLSLGMLVQSLGQEVKCCRPNSNPLNLVLAACTQSMSNNDYRESSPWLSFTLKFEPINNNVASWQRPYKVNPQYTYNACMVFVSYDVCCLDSVAMRP